MFNIEKKKKQRAYNIEIKSIYKEITTHTLNFMNHFKSYVVVKITNIKSMIRRTNLISQS